MLANATDTADVEECRWVGGDEGMTPLTKQEKLWALDACEAETPADSDRRARVEVKRREIVAVVPPMPMPTMSILFMRGNRTLCTVGVLYIL